MSDIWIGIFIGTFFGATIAFFYLVVVPWYERRAKAKKKLLDHLNESGYL